MATSMTTKIFIFFISIWWRLPKNQATVCSPDTIPHRFAAYPDGHVEVGCSKPSCFEIFLNENGTTGAFYRSASTNELQHAPESVENFHVFVSACEQISIDQNCPPNTHVLEIEPSSINKNYLYTKILLKKHDFRVCCHDLHTATTHENSIAVRLGQEIAGGKIVVDSQQVGFDYISDVSKATTINNITVYQVKTRRLYCYDEVGSVRKPEANAQAHAAPNVQAGESIEPTGTGAGARARAYQAPTIVQARQNEKVIIYRPPDQQQYYQPQQQQYYPTTDYQQPGLFCFSADTKVYLNNNEYKRMDELTIGDWVYGIDDDKKLKHGKVKAWLHKLPNQLATFLKISLSNGESLKITPEHLIFKATCTNIGVKVKSANIDLTPVDSSSLEVGDCLYTQARASGAFIQSRIESIEEVEDIGIYAPLTSLETIIVNDVLASCFAVTDKREYQINFAKFVATIHGLSQKIVGNEDITDLPLSSEMIMQMMDVLLPSAKIY